jgi:hypothetical protein
MKSWIFTLLLLPGIADAQVPTMKAADLAALAETAPPPREPVPATPAPPLPPARDAGPDAPIVVVPNAKGILDLAGIGQTEDSDRVPNPFRVRHRPQLQFRELPLAIGSVLVGDGAGEAAVIINGELYAAGDRLEDMAITSITADSVELRRGPILLKVPVQDQPTILRLP